MTKVIEFFVMENFKKNLFFCNRKYFKNINFLDLKIFEKS